MILGRVPLKEPDPKNTFAEMYNSCVRFKKLLKDLNPGERFVIELDNREPVIVTPASEVNFPETWNENN